MLRFRILAHYGFTSSEYVYFYYYSDALLTIALYLALISLFVHVFREMRAEKYVIFGACLLVPGIAAGGTGIPTPAGGGWPARPGGTGSVLSHGASEGGSNRADRCVARGLGQQARVEAAQGFQLFKRKRLHCAARRFAAL